MVAKPACESLVLDAGPLLSLSPLRGLASRYLTVPQVLAELRDKNAREHFERLALTTGVKVEVLEPDATSISQVIQFAKKTGDYSVLSFADICVLALTHALDKADKATRLEEGSIVPDGVDETTTLTSNALTSQEGIEEVKGVSLPEDLKAEAVGDLELEEIIEKVTNIDVSEDENTQEHQVGSVGGDAEGQRVGAEGDDEEPLGVVLEQIDPSTDELPHRSENAAPSTSSTPTTDSNTPLFEDPSEDDDGEGDWITPTNVDMYKTKAMDLLPSSDSTDPFVTVQSKRKGRPGRKGRPTSAFDDEQDKEIAVGCMTADFAMQNVLLQMGLNLVGAEGKRIQKVKTWVPRCHACYKICKDNTKKFCPSCGNPTLLRTSVTVKSPTANDSAPAMEVHLKKNFAYRTRGTVYSIPKPKTGSAKTGTGDSLILREDQTEFMRAIKHEQGRREREERKILKHSVEAANAGKTPGVGIGNWMDPDWIPEMLVAGTGGKGRHVNNSRVPLGPDGLPIIGFGKKNPNERRRKR